MLKGIRFGTQFNLVAFRKSGFDRGFEALPPEKVAGLVNAFAKSEHDIVVVLSSNKAALVKAGANPELIVEKETLSSRGENGNESVEILTGEEDVQTFIEEYAHFEQAKLGPDYLAMVKNNPGAKTINVLV